MAPANWPGDCALIPTGNEASSLACVRSLARRDIGSIVVSEKDQVPAARSRFCRESIRVPDRRTDGAAYRDRLLELAERTDVRTVIPIRPEDSYLLSRDHEAFATRVSLVVPPISPLRTALDRLALAEAAEDIGVPVPRTRRLTDETDWDEDVIIKSRYNVLASPFVSDLGPDELDVVKEFYHVPAGTTPDVDGIRRSMRHDPIVQEFIPKGGEYVFAALYDRGEPLATFQHHQIRGNSYTGGGGVYRRSVDIPELDAVGRALLDGLDWHGLACIEYVRDRRSGEFVLVEINPRMWQSLPLAIRAGADFPYYYWLQATGRTDEVESGFALDCGCHLLAGELGYLLSVVTDDSPLVPRPSFPGAAWAIASSCLLDPHFDYLRLDDPQPFVAGLGAKVRRKLKR